MDAQSGAGGLDRDLHEAASVIGRLARDEKSFLSAYEAFRAGDRDKFQAALNHLGLTIHCGLVCEWMRSKECIFLCQEVCGPPVALEREPDIHAVTEAIAKLTADPKSVRELVSMIEKRDRAGFERLLDTHKLRPFCHLICHWVCLVIFRLRCRWVCSIGPVKRPDLAGELEQAGHALRQLLEHKEAFHRAASASAAGDADKLRSIIQTTGLVSLCHWICEWFCSWRCALVCLTFCRPFPPVEVKSQLEEAFAFARAIRALTEHPAELARLSKGLGEGDQKSFAAAIEALKLERFCLQFCHWICTLRCRGFCIWICPPIFYHPWFTHVGDFGVMSDFAPGTGLTNKAQAGHGGPDFGFFGNLTLRGFCPHDDPANPGQAMSYRFLFQPAGAAAATPVTAGFVSEVLVGSRYTLWNGNPMTLQSVRIRGAGATPTPPPPGPGLTPPDHFIVPDANGWVAVDDAMLGNAFSGALLGLASGAIVPGGSSLPGVLAGSPVPLGNRKDGVDGAIIFQATRTTTVAMVNGGAAPDYSNQLAKILINNWAEVRLLNLLQFHSGGGNPCSPLTNDLDIEYTTDHELLADWHLALVTASGMTLTSPPSGPTPLNPRGDAGSYHEDISSWPTCSYTVQLHTRRRLTDGFLDDPGNYTEMTFCIGLRRARP
jgi:hypothetical protein